MPMKIFMAAEVKIILAVMLIMRMKMDNIAAAAAAADDDDDVDECGGSDDNIAIVINSEMTIILSMIIRVFAVANRMLVKNGKRLG
ncbi:hypothetical protein PoB_006410300 [Plakobranchus ocellatus]|uniref:Secreted protein n=1 Tax=Plakobranchus ocellatus TaxID=259542 RepID=A0AAV4D0M7_9GAST|nr:hypothetical protein PoB_006410300 [Plakobranchus ocellatus]